MRQKFPMRKNWHQNCPLEQNEGVLGLFEIIRFILERSEGLRMTGFGEFLRCAILLDNLINVWYRNFCCNEDEKMAKLLAVGFQISRVRFAQQFTP